MAIRKIEMRPPGSGDYADVLHPRTSADIVVSTDGNVQADINGLKTNKAEKTYVDTELGKKAPTSHNHTKANITDFAHTHPKSEITDFPALGTASSKNTGTASGNVPVIGADGKLDTGIMPALAITDTFVVATQAAMLALTAQTGDVAVRTDISTSFILKAEPASVLANWQELLTPADKVQSVNGKSGVVTLTAGDVGASATGHKHAKADITDFPALSTVATSGSYNDLGNKPTIPSKTSQLTNDSQFVTQTELGSAGYGDMLKSIYDTNNNGIVDRAALADSVTWANVSGKPSTFSPSTHNHTKSQITDMPTALSQFSNDVGFITKSLTIGTVQPSDGTLWFKEI